MSVGKGSLMGVAQMAPRMPPVMEPAVICNSILRIICRNWRNRSLWGGRRYTTTTRYDRSAPWAGCRWRINCRWGHWRNTLFTTDSHTNSLCIYFWSWRWAWQLLSKCNQIRLWCEISSWFGTKSSCGTWTMTGLFRIWMISNESDDSSPRLIYLILFIHRWIIILACSMIKITQSFRITLICNLWRCSRFSSMKLRLKWEIIRRLGQLMPPVITARFSIRWRRRNSRRGSRIWESFSWDTMAFRFIIRKALSLIMRGTSHALPGISIRDSIT